MTRAATRTGRSRGVPGEVRAVDFGTDESVARSLLGERRHAIGKTRVYLGPGVLEFLERLLSTAHARSATSINTCARRYLQLRRFSVLRQTAILVQRRRRGFVRRRSFVSLVAASITLQAVARSRRTRKATTHKRRRVSATKLAAWAGEARRTEHACATPRSNPELQRRILAVVFVDKLRRNARTSQDGEPACRSAEALDEEAAGAGREEAVLGHVDGRVREDVNYLRTEVAKPTPTATRSGETML